MSKPWIIGHRGVADIRENTIESFEMALERGVDAIEFDVRRAGDGRLVVVHDSVVNDLAVNSNPYESFRDLGEGSVVPLLEEVLEKFAKRTTLDIEFKAPGFEAEAVEMIRTHAHPETTLISAFDAKLLQRVHELWPDVQLGYIYNRTQDESARHHAPIDVVIPQFRLASRELIEEIHDEEIKVWAWTVNEEAEMQRLLRLGVDGLITDYPARAKRAIDGLGS